MNFGENLRALRLAAGLTQEELARRIGARKQTLSRYESSSRQPGIMTARKIADALGVSLERLTGPEALFASESPLASPAESCPVVPIYNNLNEPGKAEYLRYGRYLSGQPEYQAEKASPPVEYIRHYLTAAAAGYAAPIEGEDYELIPKGTGVPARADFCIDIAGDSMEPYIKDGQMVYVQRGADLKEFEVGIFFVDGDVYCKQWCEGYSGELYLLSANPGREDANITIPRDSGRNCVCFGKVLLPKKLPRPVYD